MQVERGWFVPTIQFGPDDVFILEDWDVTPAGPYRAVFHFTPGDHRTLYASTTRGRDLVSTIHRFDDTHVVDIDSVRDEGRWTIEADTGDRGVLRLEMEFRETPLLKLVNPVACHTPEFIARSSLYCAVVPRLAGPLLGIDRDQKLAARTETGRFYRFRSEKIYKVTGARCSWGGRDLGPMAECRYDHDIGENRLATRPVVSYLSMFVD